MKRQGREKPNFFNQYYVSAALFPVCLYGIMIFKINMGIEYYFPDNETQFSEVK